MAGILEAIAGIVVSVILFVLGYRSTIGARKERIKTARAEAVRVLVRLAAVDSAELTPVIIQRTIAGIAAQQGVETSAVGPPSLIANLLYAEVMKSDLMDGPARQSILLRIEGAFRVDLGDTGEEGEAAQGVRPIRPSPAAPSEATREAQGTSENIAIGSSITKAKLTERESRESRRETGGTILLGALSVILAIAGVLSVFVSQSHVSASELAAVVGATVGLMAGIVGVIIARQREQARVQEENIQDADPLRAETQTVYEILRAIREAGGKFTRPRNQAADMRIELSDGSVLLAEFKWTVDRKTLHELADRLVQASHELGASEIFIIALNPPGEDMMARLERDLPDQIHLMTGAEFVHTLQGDPATRQSRTRRLK